MKKIWGKVWKDGEIKMIKKGELPLKDMHVLLDRAEGSIQDTLISAKVFKDVPVAFVPIDKVGNEFNSSIKVKKENEKSIIYKGKIEFAFEVKKGAK